MKNRNGNRNIKGGFFKELFTTGNDKINGTLIAESDTVTKDGSPVEAANVKTGNTIKLNEDEMNVTGKNETTDDNGNVSYNVMAEPIDTGTNTTGTNTTLTNTGGARRGGARSRRNRNSSCDTGGARLRSWK